MHLFVIVDSQISFLLYLLGRLLFEWVNSCSKYALKREDDRIAQCPSMCRAMKVPDLIFVENRSNAVSGLAERKLVDCANSVSFQLRKHRGDPSALIRSDRSSAIPLYKFCPVDASDRSEGSKTPIVKRCSLPSIYISRPQNPTRASSYTLNRDGTGRSAIIHVFQEISANS